MTFGLLRNHLPRFNCSADCSSDAVLQYSRFYKLSELKARHRIGTLDSGEFTLVAQSFCRNQPIASAIVIHGFMDHTGLYGKLIRSLLDQNYNVFMIDLPGHGLSSGKPAAIDSFFDYTCAVQSLIDALKLIDTPPLRCLIGQSMGGAIAMSLLKQQPQNIPKTVLLAPLVQPRLWPMLAPVHTVLRRVITHLRRGFKGNSHDKDFNQFLSQHDPLQCREIPLQWISAMRDWRDWLLTTTPSPEPVLLIQGTADTTVDWRFGNRQIKRLFPNCQQALVPNAMHHLANESDQYRKPVFEQISVYLNQ